MRCRQSLGLHQKDTWWCCLHNTWLFVSTLSRILMHAFRFRFVSSLLWPVLHDVKRLNEWSPIVYVYTCECVLFLLVVAIQLFHHTSLVNQAISPFISVKYRLYGSYIAYSFCFLLRCRHLFSSLVRLQNSSRFIAQAIHKYCFKILKSG